MNGGFHSGWNIMKFIKAEHSDPKKHPNGETYEAYKFTAINMVNHEMPFVFVLPFPQKNRPNIIRDLLGCVGTKYWMDVKLVEQKRCLRIVEMRPLKMPQEELNLYHRLRRGEPGNAR